MFFRSMRCWVFGVVVAGGLLGSKSAWADSLEEIKAMMQQMKSDYEARIQELEAKIEQLGSQQQATQGKVSEIENKQTQQVADIEKKLDDSMLNVEYVG